MDFVTVRTEVQAAGFDDWTSKIEQRGGTRSPNRCERSRSPAGLAAIAFRA